MEPWPFHEGVGPVPIDELERRFAQARDGQALAKRTASRIGRPADEPAALGGSPRPPALGLPAGADATQRLLNTQDSKAGGTRPLPVIDPPTPLPSLVPSLRRRRLGRLKRLFWLTCNLTLVSVALVLLGGGVVLGIIAVERGYSAWTDGEEVDDSGASRTSHTPPARSSRGTSQVPTIAPGEGSGPPAAKGCEPPGALPPPQTDGLLETTVEGMDIRTGPGEACGTLGTLRAGLILTPLSGPVRGGGHLWVFVRIYGSEIEGWIADEVVREYVGP